MLTGYLSGMIPDDELDQVSWVLLEVQFPEAGLYGFIGFSEILPLLKDFRQVTRRSDEGGRPSVEKVPNGAHFLRHQSPKGVVKHGAVEVQRFHGGVGAPAGHDRIGNLHELGHFIAESLNMADQGFMIGFPANHFLQDLFVSSADDDNLDPVSQWHPHLKKIKVVVCPKAACG